jgi:hypothetical protein
VALSDTARIAIIREVTRGVTPATPAFEILRINSESIVWEAESVPDPELNPDRTLRDVIGTGGAVRGSLETNLAFNATFDDLFEAIFGAAWVSDVLDPGTTLLTFTIEKRLLNEDGSYSYHRFTGVTFSSVRISSQPDAPVTCTWTVRGGQYSVDTAIIAGATYVDPSPDHTVAPAMRGQDMVLNFSGSPAIVSHCFTACEFTVDSQVNATKCLGIEGENDLHLGKFVVPFTANVVYKGVAMITRWLDQTSVVFQIAFFDTTASPANHSYTFTLPRVKIVQAGPAIPASGELLTQEIACEATTDALGAICSLTRATA